MFDFGSLIASVSFVLLSVEAIADVANKLPVISMIRQADKRVIIVIRFVFIIAVILSSIAFLLKLLQSGNSPLFFASILISINE